MRFSTVLLTLSAIASASASVYPRQSLPSCALPCLANADFGNCGNTDNSCLCKSPAFVNGTTTCIESACSGSDLANAIAYSQALCAAVGVTLTSTPVAASTSASASASATSAASSSSAVSS
ncbi:hypothetical protein FIBSPDRAFT_95271 [Athelia psychrophila]|uniref:CFEM domain-containing protein n=1 Tax=Athelia psychrophila TaxID=1759441 RepID=A0A166TQJ2_9AGAM|nr:hypothetical protein FIBSPDRAFT_95271 [Fibularhizoctonia sp. CBS 109695]